MKKKIIAGNWKMNHSLRETCDFIENLKLKLSLLKDLNSRILLAPSYPFLDRAFQLAKGTQIEIMAQNIHHKSNGAFTGEVSASMMHSLGLNCSIIGHSERRAYFGESDELILEKILQALEYKMEVILCIGENEKERENGNYFEIIKTQLEKTLFQLDANQIKTIMIAYEPIWAIGTGKSASATQAQQMHEFIKKIIKENFDCKLPVLYGGSLNTKNAKEILAQKDIDGGLIGGASLKAEDFFELIKIACII